jgi:hypothetical protein
MSTGLYVERETHPFVAEGTEIMFIFRDGALANALPNLYITALENDCEVDVKSGFGGNTNAFTSTTNIMFAQKGQKERVGLPIGGDIIDLVSVMEVTRGKVAVTVVSPLRVKMEFRTRKHPK